MPWKHIRNVVTVDFYLNTEKEGELGSIVQWQRKVSKTSWQRSKACKKCSVYLHLDEMHSKSEFFTVQHSIAIRIRQLPNFSKHLESSCDQMPQRHFFHGTLLGRWDFIISSLAARPSKKYFSIIFKGFLNDF